MIKKGSMDYSRFDFLDFGASKAASLEFGKKHFFGKRGLGVDLDPERVDAMNREGYDCMVGDLTNLKVPAGCVKFVKMAHILEHMPNLKGVEKALESAKKAATDFLVITGPFFDEDKYLASKGLKLAWADYPEHTCHLTVAQLINILDKLKLDNYEIYLRYPIVDSSSEHVHPLASPPSSHRYDPRLHPSKKRVSFDRPIWTDFVCYVRLKDKVKNWDKITQGYRDQIPYLERLKGAKYMASSRMMDQYHNLIVNNQKLKEQSIKLSDELSALKQKQSAIQSSRTWKLASSIQSAYRPVRVLRAIKQKI
jgi:hypothetical protein